MRDKGLDKGLIREFDDSKRDKRGYSKGFFGFRKMFRDYLTKLNVAFFDTCCPAATTEGIVPVRYNDTTDTLQYFDVTTETWLPVELGEFTADTIQLANGTVAAPSLAFGADTNDGLYGIADGQLGVSLEGTLALQINPDSIQTGGVAYLDGTAFAGFYKVAAAQNITASTGGAINITSYYTSINTDAGGDAYTLAAGGTGVNIGMLKRIRLVADGGGDGTVTVTSGSGFTTLTFNDAGDEIELMWTGTAWVILVNIGVTVA